MEIKNINEKVIFTSNTAKTMAELVTEAVKAKANISHADLSYANLSDADLSHANLSRANLSGANLERLDWAVCPEAGSFHAFKKVKTFGGEHAVIEISVSADTPRTNSIGSRKCRAAKVFVVGPVSGPVAEVYYSPTNVTKSEYRIGEYTGCDNFSDSITDECTGGIHFFMTRKEAERWGK